MGALKYVEELQKKKQSDMMRFLMRVRVRTTQLAIGSFR
jgi:large subunit ribosomal protein L15e